MVIVMKKSTSFTDFEKPPLWTKIANVAGKWLRLAGIMPDSFNVNSLMSKAIKNTGLKDFGPTSFREGLDKLIESLNREANLNTVGRIAIKTMLLNSLEVRLKAKQWINEHPEVVEEQIEKPFFIVGLPRTGTTILSFLLDMDPENRSLVHWQASSPVPPPELSTVNEDPRIESSIKRLRLFESVIPNIQSIHHMAATIPTECIELFLHEFMQPAFGMFAIVNDYAEWFKDADMESTYNYHKLILQILQSRLPTETWSLKAPMHIWMLNDLYKVYPDARIIFTHRDLQKVIPSVCSLMLTFRKSFSDYVDTIDIGEKVMIWFKRGVTKAMEFEDEQANHNISHLQYNNFIMEPIKTVEEIYAHFGKKVRPLHKKKMQAWLKFNPKDKHGKHNYSLSDYGLTADQVKEEFKEYITRYNIPLEE